MGPDTSVPPGTVDDTALTLYAIDLNDPAAEVEEILIPRRVITPDPAPSDAPPDTDIPVSQPETTTLTHTQIDLFTELWVARRMNDRMTRDRIYEILRQRVVLGYFISYFAY